MAVSRKLCGAVIGQKGQTIRDFMLDSGATIRVQVRHRLSPCMHPIGRGACRVKKSVGSAHRGECGATGLALSMLLSHASGVTYTGHLMCRIDVVEPAACALCAGSCALCWALLLSVLLCADPSHLAVC